MSVSQVPDRIEGYAIVSEDGMLANSAGVMPDSLKFKADQAFFERGLDGLDVIVHGRHSHEQQRHSDLRRRLILTHRVLDRIDMMSSICHARRVCAFQVEDRYFRKYRCELRRTCLNATGLNPVSTKSLTQKRPSRLSDGVAPQKSNRRDFLSDVRYARYF